MDQAIDSIDQQRETQKVKWPICFGQVSRTIALKGFLEGQVGLAWCPLRGGAFKGDFGRSILGGSLVSQSLGGGGHNSLPDLLRSSGLALGLRESSPPTAPPEVRDKMVYSEGTKGNRLP